MILACHVIISAYGFWLPNDPRGSWSDFVGAWELVRFGRATKVDTHRSVAARPHDVQSRLAAKKALKYPEVHFGGLQARAVGRGFAEFVTKSGLVIWACSILPDHVHLVIARYRFAVEQASNLLKGAATRRLTAEGLHPMAGLPMRGGRLPTPWGRGEWKVFLRTHADVRRAVAYVAGNPAKEGLPPQRWSFVRPFNG
jgi:REP element-mobilizing transposase RayT